MHTINFAMMSDPGRVRRRNEDACAANPDQGVFVVCDGVGGVVGGEVASRLAADAFLTHLVEMKVAGISPEVAMHKGVEHANRIVYRQSGQNAALRGMATTLVALSFEPWSEPTDSRSAWLANVGDSRCYRLRSGSLEQLSADHSVVEEQVRAGSMTREQAELSPIRNVITRAVGSETAVAADIKQLDVLPGDIYLLSSDGLMRELSDTEIATILTAVPEPVTTDDEPASNAALEEACIRLVSAANKSGGGDNITCLVIQIV